NALSRAESAQMPHRGLPTGGVSGHAVDYGLFALYGGKAHQILGNLPVNVLEPLFPLVQIIEGMYFEVRWKMLGCGVSGRPQVDRVRPIKQVLDFHRDLLPGPRPQARNNTSWHRIRS